MMMRSAFRLGRLFGIELRVDSSWLLILVLVVWSLTGLFASWHPDWSPATSFVVAVFAAFAFFGSVLVHELAHSLVAKLYGIPVRDITLHMFGGVSNIEREPPTPGAELLIAIVGPVSSVVIGVLMLFVGASITGLGELDATSIASAEQIAARMGPLTTMLMWLGPVNIMVGLFNLVPGFPLDGGRVLRAILWRATGDLTLATTWAASVGQGVGWAFILAGGFMVLGYGVPIFGRGLGSGVWLALIGFFLRGVAFQQQVGARIARALSGFRVADLMRTTGPWVTVDVPLSSLAQGWLLRHDERALPVFEAGSFVGLVTLDDLRPVPVEEWQSRTVRDVMTPQGRLVTVEPSDAAYEALRRLGASGVLELPVVHDGALVGILHERDVARWLELEQSRRGVVRERPA